MDDRTDDVAPRREPVALVPAGELRKLADLLRGMEPDLADDLLAGLATRMLRDLSRRWADTVTTWALEAELWGASPSPSGDVEEWLDRRSDAELVQLVRLAVLRLGSRQGRTPREILTAIADAPG
jgi:hypothetical protein